MTAVAGPDDAVPLGGEIPEPTFFGHPRGLWYLAFTEAWEGFSYQGMQSLLVLYLVKYLLLPGRIEPVAGIADPGHKQNSLPEFRRCASDCPAFRLCT